MKRYSSIMVRLNTERMKQPFGVAQVGDSIQESHLNYALFLQRTSVVQVFVRVEA